MDVEKGAGPPVAAFHDRETLIDAQLPPEHVVDANDRSHYISSVPRWWRRSGSSPAGHRPLIQWREPRDRLLLVFLVLCAYVFWPTSQLWAVSSDPVDAVLAEVPLIDTHIDFPIYLRYMYSNHINNITADTKLPFHVDFPRLRKGRLGGVFWSVYVPCPEEGDTDVGPGYDNQFGINASKDFPDSLYTESVAMTYEQLDLVNRMARRWPGELSLTLTSSAMFHNHQFPPPDQTIGSVAGGEGLHSIGNKASNLRMFYDLGMRYITLAHNCHNAYADAAVAPNPPVHGGLSDAGRAIVREMNRIGMIVDISHVTAETASDAIKASKAPVLFSHSGARAVTDHPRNVPDAVLDELKATEGVISVPFAPDFISTDPEKADLAAVADHIMYIGERIGFEHVGIGSDFDGILSAPRGLEDVSKYPDLLRELWRRGLTQAQLAQVAGYNVLRVMRRVERVAALMSGEPALEDDIHVTPPNITRLDV